MSTNTILIECNRMNSEGAASFNHSIWTNNVSEGLQLNPGDRVSVESAFINEIGSGAQTIEFSDDIVETGVKENELTITMEYYKNADAECCFVLPRLYCPDYDTSDGSGLVTPHDNDTDDTYNVLYRRGYDGGRYTIYNQTSEAAGGAGESDIAVYSAWQRVTQDLTLTVDTGYNTTSDISSQLTETLHKTESLDISSNSISVSSSTFKPVKCANIENFSRVMNTDWNDPSSGAGGDYTKAFQTIGVYDPELFEAGNNLFSVTVYSYDHPKLVLSDPDNHFSVAKLKAVFDAQSNRSDLIFGDGITTDNTRFLHINKTAGQGLMLGSDIDYTRASVRLFLTYDGTFPKEGDKWVFTLQGPKTPGIADIVRDQAVGWDPHFSAYGVDCIMLFTGYGTAINPGYGKTIEGTYSTPYVEQVYIGAINPVVSFDSGSSRFQIQRLHTPRKQRNTLFAGKELSVPMPDKQVHYKPVKQPNFTKSEPINPDAGDDIYEINPILNKTTMQTLMPYIPEARSVSESQSLIDNFNIIDAMTGVYITDWGVSQGNWSKSIWGKLGFSYEQLHQTTIQRQGRNTNTSIVTNPVTTNADVNSTQAMNWAVNLNGAPQDTLQLPQNTSKSVASISVKATSTSIRAADLAQQQEDGYWTIRSTLIDNSLYMSHGGLAPVIAVVDKSYSSSDFIYLGDSSTDFMITKQTTLTDITTSLHLQAGTHGRQVGGDLQGREAQRHPDLDH